MQSPSKVSIKRLQSNIQRERNIASEWQSKYKQAQKQKSDLMQTVVDLRREIISLNTKLKKNSKTEQRLLVISKQLQSCQKLIAQQKSDLTQSRQEMQRVRSNANQSISKWKEAQSQWLSSTECLKLQLSQLEQQIQQQKKVNQAGELTIKRLQDKLKHQQNINQQAKTSFFQLQSQFKQTMCALSDQQNKTYSLQQNLQRLAHANDHLIQELRRKQMQIQLLRAQCNKHAQHEMNWNDMQTDLIGKVNAQKVINAKTSALYQTASVDLQNAKKQNTRLSNMIQMLNRKFKSSEQNEAALLKKNSQLKQKNEQLQQALSKKTLQVKEKELVLSQQQLAKKKLQVIANNSRFDSEKLNKQRQLLQSNYNALMQEKIQLQSKVQALIAEVGEMRQKNDKAGQELVLIKNQLQQRVQRVQLQNKTLMSHIEQRQRIINDLTSQLTRSNQNAAQFHNSLIKEQQKLFIKNNELQRLKKAFDIFTLTASVNELIFTMNLEAKDHQILINEIWHQTLQQYCLQFAKVNNVMRKEHKQLIFTLLTQQQQQARQHVFVQQQAAILQIIWQQYSRYIMIINTMQQNNRGLALKLAKQQQQVNLLTSNIVQLKSERMQFQIRQSAVRRNMVDHNEELIHQMHVLESEKKCVSCLLAREAHWLTLYNELQSQYSKTSFDIMFEAVAENCLHNFLVMKQQFGSVQDSLRHQIADMKHFVKEAKQSIQQQRVQSLCKLRNMVDQNMQVKGRLQICQRQKEQLQEQVSQLIRSQQCHQLYTDQLNKQWSQQLLQKDVICRSLSAQIEKNKKELAYEIDRKQQYKVAVVQLKKLRLELQQCRKKQKKLAITAVQKANLETQYWRDSFQKLKKMIRQTNCNNMSLPLKTICENVDTKSVNFTKSEIKERLLSQSQPLQTEGNEDNILQQDCEKCTTLKRLRADSA